MKAKDIASIIHSLSRLENISDKRVQKIFRKYPKKNSGLYSKSETLDYFLKNKEKLKLTENQEKRVLKAIRMKANRTISGVTPVTVLTKPYPCPGKCIFCPNDPLMPKSYLSDEPGAQRAFRNKFDPYAQTFNRLLAYKNIGHPTDKVELIILGGTWTAYPKDYQIWFVKRCFDAMNNFNEDSKEVYKSNMNLPYTYNIKKKNGAFNPSYNKQVINEVKISSNNDKATWDELFKSHKKNESAKTRCVGLVIETRPDEITKDSVIQIRKLGTTKVQIGLQSLDDKVLKMNHRGHNVKTSAKAMNLLRQAGFKIHAHYMPNLYGSNPKKDIADFKKLFTDKNFKPDELKIYPCSLIEGTELMDLYKDKKWKPYTEKELLQVLKECMKIIPPYCRVTRMIRDIGSHDIVAGNKKTNFRQIVENEIKKEKVKTQEIRSREIREQTVSEKDLKLDIVKYKTAVSEEYFLQYITKDNKIAGFMRLSLPTKPLYIDELKDSAIIREIHIYGQSIEIGDKKEGTAQHLGLGKKLIKEATKITKEKGYKKLAVISSIGTREYYYKNGFLNLKLYQVTDTIKI